LAITPTKELPYNKVQTGGSLKIGYIVVLLYKALVMRLLLIDELRNIL